MNEDVRQNIVMYRMGKARQLLHDVDVLMENELWNSTINRMYYACFHAVSALLIKNGIEVKSHGDTSSVWTSFCQGRKSFARIWANLLEDI